LAPGAVYVEPRISGNVSGRLPSARPRGGATGFRSNATARFASGAIAMALRGQRRAAHADRQLPEARLAHHFGARRQRGCRPASRADASKIQAASQRLLLAVWSLSTGSRVPAAG
jgi:hypothetical protein